MTLPVFLVVHCFHPRPLSLGSIQLQLHLLPVLAREGFQM